MFLWCGLEILRLRATCPASGARPEKSFTQQANRKPRALIGASWRTVLVTRSVYGYGREGRGKKGTEGEEGE